jgi:hypothetical protein
LRQRERLEVVSHGEVEFLEIGEALGVPLKSKFVLFANWSLQWFDQLDDAFTSLLQ